MNEAFKENMKSEEEITIVWGDIPEIDYKDILGSWKLNWYDGRMTSCIGTYEDKKVYVSKFDEAYLKVYPTIHTYGHDINKENEMRRVSSYTVTEIEDHEYKILANGSMAYLYTNDRNIFSETHYLEDVKDGSFDWDKQNKDEDDVFNHLKTNRQPLGYFTYGL